MKIFKFGGASVQDAMNLRNATNIVKTFAPDDDLVIVISAIGKTTNALEKVSLDFFENRQKEALRLFQDLKDFHLEIVKQLLEIEKENCESQLRDLFTEVEWLLHDQPVREYNYYYDQIVCLGELLSSTIFSFTLKENGLENAWIDVRDIIRTSNNYREAIIDWEFTGGKMQETILPLVQKEHIIVTQGFIGATDDNESTTLGREGSDFTAAIFGNLLETESVTIWKDVDGVMSADPKIYPEAQSIRHLDYEEVIEMAFYGAQVIHPKTIKPLQNKNIPLLVKCFKNVELEGTVINGEKNNVLPPLIIVKRDQALVTLKTKDFAFIGGKPLEAIYEALHHNLLKANLISIGAITIQICVDNDALKLENLKNELETQFEFSHEEKLELTTLRHYTVDAAQMYLPKSEQVISQKDPKTIQVISKF
ncbi:aspartate kinase [Rhizosphaericola mali]|uniref:Aspartokinase n=1 Tax=Rhizosphaericola mali TaxID=2545455 RepID=A0A5P2FZT2_9BACT|nr:aspartate kinase [Rhizosphaericola mali]QES88477.1 aspartate kinase [Rhizosphaericola mali]